MLDFKKILTRSWQVLWTYRTLWIFGFILALTTGGANIGNQSRYTFSDRRSNNPSGIETPGHWEGLQGDTFAEQLQDAFRQAGRALDMLREQYPAEFRLGIAALVTLFVVILVFGILGAFLRYTAETATIRMVDEHETSGVKVGFRQAWRYGWNRAAWRAFLVNFLVNLPVLGLFVLIGLVAWRIFAALMGGVQATIVSSIIAGSGLVFLGIFVTVIVMAVLYVVRDFAWRMIVLEGAGVRESLGRAFALLRKEWRNIGLMWLIMIGIKIAWSFIFLILVIPLLVLSIVTMVGGVAVALVPTLLTAGLASLLSVPGFWPWVFAGIIGLPFFFVVGFSPVLLVAGWGKIFDSSVWTLTYRELLALEAGLPAGTPEEPEALNPAEDVQG